MRGRKKIYVPNSLQPIDSSKCLAKRVATAAVVAASTAVERTVSLVMDRNQHMKLHPPATAVDPQTRLRAHLRARPPASPMFQTDTRVSSETSYFLNTLCF